MTLSADLKQTVPRVIQTFETWVLGSIKVTFDATKDDAQGSTPLAAFILTSCAIDFLAGFMCGIDSFKPKQQGESSRNYKAFVRRYLPQYDPEDVYSKIRCRLAHNYSIGSDLALTHKNPAEHDPEGKRGPKLINFEQFFADFQRAGAAYFKDLETDTTLQANFTKRVALGFAQTVVLPARQSEPITEQNPS